MIVQDGEKLQLVTSAAESVDYVAHFSDGRAVQGNVVEATSRELAQGPRTLVSLIAVNVDSGAQTVALKKSVKGNRVYQLTPTIDLAAGEALYYDGRFYVMDATGRIKYSTA